MAATPMTPEERELAFLRYFFANARHGMGPSDGDIYYMIMETYEDRTGERIPEPYRGDYLGVEEDE